MVPLRIATWNINGLRSGQEKVIEFLTKNNVDILCLQEIKVDDKSLSEELKNFDGYQSYWFHAEKPGYAGVAIYSRKKISKVEYGMGEPEFDREGRAIIVHFKDLVLANFYFPHSGRDLSRLNFKLKMNKAFLKFIQKFDKDKLLVCGDLNVAHQELDLARPKDNKKNAGFTQVERDDMTKFLDAGLIDIYRKLNPEKREYTWWSQRASVRERNIGWRIDYFLCYRSLLEKVNKIEILPFVYGSDHCPVLVELKD